MKKSYFIFVVLLIIGFTEIAKGQSCDCPEGYTQRSIRVTGYPAMPNNCHWDITYCCKWDDVNKKLSVINTCIWHPHNCLVRQSDWGPFHDWFMYYVWNDAILNCAPDYPPCDPHNPPDWNMDMKTYWCVRYENWYVSWEHVWEVAEPACNTQYFCLDEWKICVDYSVSPPQIVILDHRRTSYADPNCSTQEPEVPPPGHTWFDHWITDCFSLPCN